jgi:photosystem II stability/assembly factor-like uncharacterized protein
MKHRVVLLSRRGFAAASLGMGAALSAGVRRANALTGIYAIDSPAIPVLHPTKASLQAVTVAGSRLVAAGEHGVIIYSDDNAKTWTQASVPVDLLLTSLSFATPLIGWAAGNFGVVLKTVDGGKTWQTQLNGVQVATLTMQAAQQAVAQNFNSAGTALAERRANAFMNDGPDKPFLSILALDSQKVIAFGASRMTVITTDGGKTWTEWSLHIDNRLSNTLFAAALIGSSIYVVGEEGLIFCSTDGGNSFPALASPTTTTLFGVLEAKDGSVIVYGVAGSAFRSADGGKTWTAINITAPDDLLCGILLDSGEIIIASESELLYISADNGANFTLFPNFSPGSVFDMVEISNKQLILAGAGGIALMSAKNIEA